MGKSEKQIEKEKARNQRIIDTAFQIFVEKKIEATTGICITNAIQTNGTLLTSEIYNFLKQE